MPGCYEFFAGGGMARAGLGPGWTCLFANDFDGRKGLTYQDNWGAAGELALCDLREVTAVQLPDHADLIWGSFPCQDLSLAGNGAGLKGGRSGTFYPLSEIVKALIAEGRGPRMVAVARWSSMLRSSCRSRGRGCSSSACARMWRSPLLVSSGPVDPFHTAALTRAVDGVGAAAREQLVWWKVATPPLRTRSFAQLIEEEPTRVSWDTGAETRRLLSLMSPINLDKVNAAKRSGRRMVGGVYRRTRLDETGAEVQRAEIRFDDVAGCLCTPAGGSSRQVIMVVDGESVRSRLISTRETARLMGLDDSYRLPRTFNGAYHLTGDGLVVPVVRNVARYVLQSLLRRATTAFGRDVRLLP